jgi:transcriptional regulator with XRE-family HTH domain
VFGPLTSAGLMPKTVFTGANQAVVEVIRQARVGAGLTQAELAARIGRDQSHVSLIEGSQRRLDLVEFHQISRALGQDPVALFARIASRIDELERGG